MVWIQGSLSSQLLGAGGGMYDFGREATALHRDRAFYPSSQLYCGAHMYLKSVIKYRGDCEIL